MSSKKQRAASSGGYRARATRSRREELRAVEPMPAMLGALAAAEARIEVVERWTKAGRTYSVYGPLEAGDHAASLAHEVLAMIGGPV